MKHYLKNQEVWGIESDGSQNHLVTPDMVLLSDGDLYALRNPPKTAEQIRADAKAARTVAVEAIRVTTQAGHTFDGDEVSQGRMARAIIALQATGTESVAWVLADNTAMQASAAELSEALALAGASQAALWVLP